ncbi:MAG: type II toxin-antitoxin system VapC family toxin [bacterium]|nr:type II toxin-antitoxin system VapC family toxin [bacterium]
MKFWDTSALVPLVVREEGTSRVHDLLASDPDFVLWWGSVVECTSALARSHREGHLDREGVHQSLALLRALREAAFEIQPGEDVRSRAARLLFVHPLRAADAFQLAAALIWCRERTSGAGFVGLDTRLRDAATREGFEVLPP